MKEKKPRVFLAAFKYSIPVLLGYLAIGAAFGLMMANEGYAWWLSLVMCVVMFAGVGQYIAVGLFAAGTTIWEAMLVQFVANARHIAYGLSMIKRFDFPGFQKFYCIFGMTDETYALLSSLPADEGGMIRVPGIAQAIPSDSRGRFMFLVTLLDHGYWTLGGVIGAVTGSLLPFSTKGIEYAMTSLFIVLLIEQVYRIRRPGIFVASAIPALLGVLVLPSNISLPGALALALAACALMRKKAAVG